MFSIGFSDKPREQNYNHKESSTSIHRWALTFTFQNIQDSRLTIFLRLSPRPQMSCRYLELIKKNSKDKSTFDTFLLCKIYSLKTYAAKSVFKTDFNIPNAVCSTEYVIQNSHMLSGWGQIQRKADVGENGLVPKVFFIFGRIFLDKGKKWRMKICVLFCFHELILTR